EMRAARIFALACRKRNHAADLAEGSQVEPIVPLHVESAASLCDAGPEQLGMQGGKRHSGALEPLFIAHHTDIVPHGVEQLFPQLVQLPGLAGEWMQRA